MTQQEFLGRKWSVLKASSQYNSVSPSLYQLQAIVVEEDDPSELSTLLLCYGGEDNKGYWSNELYVLNLSLFSWKNVQWKQPKLASFPPKKDGHSMVQHGRNLVIFGGMDNQWIGGGNNGSYLLNIDELKWTALDTKGMNDDDSQIPVGRTLHSAVKNKKDNCMYVFGGKVTQATSDNQPIGTCLLGDMYKMDLDTTIWQKVEFQGDAPSPRCGHSCVYDESNDRILVFGGVIEDQQYSSDVFVFDCKTSTWSKPNTFGDVPSGRERHSAVLYHNNNNMLVYGGWVHGGASNECFDLNLTTLEWKVVPSPSNEVSGITNRNDRRYGHVAVIFNNGQQMLILGGKNQYWENVSDVLMLNLMSPDVHPIVQSSTSSISFETKCRENRTVLDVDTSALTAQLLQHSFVEEEEPVLDEEQTNMSFDSFETKLQELQENRQPEEPNLNVELVSQKEEAVNQADVVEGLQNEEQACDDQTTGNKNEGDSEVVNTEASMEKGEVIEQPESEPSQTENTTSEENEQKVETAAEE